MNKRLHRYSNIHRTKHVQRLHRVARHPFAIPFITIFGLLIVTAGLFVLLNRSPQTISPNVVLINDDKQQQIVSSKEPTVGALLSKLQIKVNEGDVVEPALTTAIKQDDFRINIYRAVPVAIMDSGQRNFAFSAATTPRSVARLAGLKIYPEDTVTTQPVTNFVTADASIGEEVIVDRATPINVNLYGAPVTIRTHATTVGDMLAEKKVTLAKQDVVTPALATPITATTQISVVRNGLSTVTVQEDIPTPTQTKHEE